MEPNPPIDHEHEPLPPEVTHLRLLTEESVLMLPIFREQVAVGFRPIHQLRLISSVLWKIIRLSYLY